jgi:hypothetical protein
MPKKSNNPIWISTKELNIYFGIGYHGAMQMLPYMQFGTHYRTTSLPSAKRKRYQFNVEEINKLLNTPREKWRITPQEKIKSQRTESQFSGRYLEQTAK